MKQGLVVENWPKFCIVWDLHSFMGFMNFFSQYIPNKYIPNMDLFVPLVQELMKRNLEDNAESLWIADPEKE